MVRRGMDDPRKAFVSCFPATSTRCSLREGWVLTSDLDICLEFKPLSKVATSDVCHECFYGGTFLGALRLASASLLVAHMLGPRSVRKCQPVHCFFLGV